MVTEQIKARLGAVNGIPHKKAIFLLRQLLFFVQSGIMEHTHYKSGGETLGKEDSRIQRK